MKTEVVFIDIIKVIMTTATDCACVPFVHLRLRTNSLARSLSYYLIVLISWNYSEVRYDSDFRYR